MATTHGTAHFVSKPAARRYYRPYLPGQPRELAEWIDSKLAEGEIHIGPPALKLGEKLTIIDAGTRYAVTAPDPGDLIATGEQVTAQ